MMRQLCFSFLGFLFSNLDFFDLSVVISGFWKMILTFLRTLLQLRINLTSKRRNIIGR